MTVPWLIAHLDWLLIGGLAVVAVSSRRHRSGNVVLALALDATPYLTLLTAAGLVSGIATSDWPLAFISAALATHQLAALEPKREGAGPRSKSGDRPELTLVCANVYSRNRTPEALAAHLLRSNPDVIVITEWNHAFEVALHRAGGDHYPHRVFDPHDTSDYAVCILSRRPLDTRSRIEHLGPLTTAHAIVPLGHEDVHIYAVNPTAIVDRGGFRTWRTQIDALADHLPTLPRPLVIVGDLNTTAHRPEFQKLLDQRMSDALAATGIGSTASFKLAATGPFSLPGPLVRLDHALISPDLIAVHSENLDANGSDHRPFTLTISTSPSEIDGQNELHPDRQLVGDLEVASR
jgi:endonuclease/exonuclease/phosphatase (EEP) superfamily protein YafD